MLTMHDDERRQMHELIEPGPALLLEARTFVLNALATGPRREAELRAAWSDLQPGHADDELQLPPHKKPWEADRNEPTLRRRSAEVALRRSLAELEAMGIVMNEPVFPAVASLKWRSGGTAGTATFGSSASPAPSQLRLVSAVGAISLPGLADAQTFMSGLAPLHLSAQTRRCLDEALRTYRASSFLASAVLLGAVSEGASYSVAEALRRRDTSVAAAYRTRSLQALNRSLRDFVAKSKRVPDAKNTADRLHSFASQMVVMRNFGAHPVGRSAQPVDHMLTESGVALVIAGLHLHLSTWTDVLTALVPARRR